MKSLLRQVEWSIPVEWQVVLTQCLKGSGIWNGKLTKSHIRHRPSDVHVLHEHITVDVECVLHSRPDAVELTILCQVNHLYFFPLCLDRDEDVSLRCQNFCFSWWRCESRRSWVLCIIFLFTFFDSGSWLLAPPIFGSIVFEVAPVLIFMSWFRIFWELTK